MKKIAAVLIFCILVAQLSFADEALYILNFVYVEGQSLELDPELPFPDRIEFPNFIRGSESISYRLVFSFLSEEIEGELLASQARRFGENSEVYPLALPGEEDLRVFIDYASPQNLIVYTSTAVLSYALVE